MIKLMINNIPDRKEEYVLLNPNYIISVSENKNKTTEIKMSNGVTFSIYDTIATIERLIKECNYE